MELEKIAFYLRFVSVLSHARTRQWLDCWLRNRVFAKNLSFAFGSLYDVCSAISYVTFIHIFKVLSIVQSFLAYSVFQQNFLCPTTYCISCFQKRIFWRNEEDEKPQNTQREASCFCKAFLLESSLHVVFFAKIKAIDHSQSDEFEFVHHGRQARRVMQVCALLKRSTQKLHRNVRCAFWSQISLLILISSKTSALCSYFSGHRLRSLCFYFSLRKET